MPVYEATKNNNNNTIIKTLFICNFLFKTMNLLWLFFSLQYCFYYNKPCNEYKMLVLKNKLCILNILAPN